MSLPPGLDFIPNKFSPAGVAQMRPFLIPTLVNGMSTPGACRGFIARDAEVVIAIKTKEAANAGGLLFGAPTAQEENSTLPSLGSRLLLNVG
jgi:hypothetical protein